MHAGVSGCRKYRTAGQAQGTKGPAILTTSGRPVLFHLEWPPSWIHLLCVVAHPEPMNLLPCCLMRTTVPRTEACSRWWSQGASLGEAGGGDRGRGA